MSKTIKLKKGFDINLAGKADKTVANTPLSETFAIKPTDFVGMKRPKLKVAEGDTVKAGSPVLFDKMQEDVMICSPVSGEVVEVKRGAKRKILEIKILADKEIEFESFKSFNLSDLQKVTRNKHMSKWLRAVFGQISSKDLMELLLAQVIHRKPFIFLHSIHTHWPAARVYF